MPTKHALVRDLVERYSGASRVFRSHQIDFYRIGALPLRDAADRQHIDLDLLVSEIEALPRNVLPAPHATRQLIGYIGNRFRHSHRHQLSVACALAHEMDQATEPCDAFPHGLPHLLDLLASSLADHLAHETHSLHPALLKPGTPCVKVPVLRAMLEHDEISDQLDTLARLTGDYTPPESATSECKTLYAICRSVDNALRLHMHLENNLLFPRFVGEQALAS